MVKALRLLMWDRTEPLWMRVAWLLVLGVVLAGAFTGSAWDLAALGFLVAVLLAFAFIDPPRRRDRQRGR